MTGNELLQRLRTTLVEFGSSLLQFLPRLLAALLILVIGWLCATLLRAVTRRVLSWARFDQIMERAGGGELLKRAGLGRPHVLVGTAAYWLTWIAVLLAAMKVLGISGAENLVADFVRLLPSVAVALVVFIIGFALASVAWRVALLAAVNARLHSAKLLAAVVRGLVLVASLAMAFEQLNIGRGVLHTTFAIVFGALMLAVAIAFGLGGRHAARRFLEERLLARGKKDDDASHL
jgi:hypothetical protein